MRLAKHLAHSGIASRRAAEVLIRDGRISIDGKIITDPARDVDGSERIAFDDELLQPLSGKRVVYAVNKPPGVVSTAHDTHGRAKVVDLVDSDHRLYPVGRLDADSTGLILLTDDGDLARLVTHPSTGCPKEYLVKVSGRPSEARLEKLRSGIRLEGERTRPCEIEWVSQTPSSGEAEGNTWLRVTLREGKSRQIRRMFAAIGHPVSKLKRVAIGPIRDDRLPAGAWRPLSRTEVERLRGLHRGQR
jgi:23S rRNA pseudouridine2605 synthase